VKAFDTHAFLWFILDDPQLSAAARDLIEDPANDVEVNPALLGAENAPFFGKMPANP
jgi:PIN domain nuclease of toxin-antitoxin system